MIVIAEANDQVPWTHAAPFPTKKAATSTETFRPLIQVQAAPASRAELQLGIGATLDAVVATLGDRRNLETPGPRVGDAIDYLTGCGVITNSTKSVDAGITVTVLLLGTERLCRFAE